MLTQIDVNSENAFLVPVQNATTKDSLLIRKITGLDAADVNLFIGEYSRDGGTYQGRRVSPRNIVLTVDLNPNPALGETVSGLRGMLYKAFLDPHPQGDNLRLTFHDDEVQPRYLEGYTEKMESDIFSSELSTMVSMICPDPYLRDVDPTVLTHPTGWTTVTPLPYTGTADTGFIVEIHVVSDTSTVTLELNGEKLILLGTFLADDIIYINTVRGQRSITMVRGTDPEFSIVNLMTPASPWLELHSQSNVMKIYGETETDTLLVIKTLIFTQAYWGI